MDDRELIELRAMLEQVYIAQSASLRAMLEHIAEVFIAKQNQAKGTTHNDDQ